MVALWRSARKWNQLQPFVKYQESRARVAFRGSPVTKKSSSRVIIDRSYKNYKIKRM